MGVGSIRTFARLVCVLRKMQIQVANIVAATEAEGPGRRFALWFQGCPLRCPGCCNPEMLSFSGGTAMTIEGVLGGIEEAQRNHAIEGITLLGGEPFAHARGASRVAKETQERGLSVMVFSGHTMEQLRAQSDLHVDRLLAETDILVDGPYLKEAPDTTRRWIGSTNQRIRFLSDRYRATDECWSEPETLEIRYSGGELSVNGFPAPGATGMWKRPKQRAAGR